MLERIASNGVRTIIVETANRFARDIVVQETGFRRLRDAGIVLVAADSPDQFTDDTPTAKAIRQMLGVIAELDRAMTVAKLRGARDRKRRVHGKCEGRKSMLERSPATVALAKALHRKREPIMSLREIAVELARQGHLSRNGTPFSPDVVTRMLQVSDAAIERAMGTD